MSGSEASLSIKAKVEAIVDAIRDVAHKSLVKVIMQVLLPGTGEQWGCYATDSFWKGLSP